MGCPLLTISRVLCLDTDNLGNYVILDLDQDRLLVMDCQVDLHTLDKPITRVTNRGGSNPDILERLTIDIRKSLF